MKNPVFVIAEAGVNHNGSIDRALEMIDVAASAGANAVKFQTFVPEQLVSKHADMANYQQKNTGKDESQLDMLRGLSLSVEQHHQLAKKCAEVGIEFMSAPFDLGSVALLADEIKVARLKVASSEVTNAPLLVAVAQTGLPIILSTGMSNLEDIRLALGALAWGASESDYPRDARTDFIAAYEQAAAGGALRDKVSLLHCTTQYPTPPDAVNLRAMETMAAEFGLPVGLSDHTVSKSIAASAVALGATIIEKHFTPDKSLPGPDHAASLEPDELAEMIANIRDVEAALGSGEKIAQAIEMENQPVARKSVVAATAIRKGDTFSAGNLAVKRPGGGVSPLDYWSLLGQVASRDYSEDEQIAEG